MKVLLLFFTLITSFAYAQSDCEETAADFWATSQEYKLGMNSKEEVLMSKTRHKSCLDSIHVGSSRVKDCSDLKADAWVTG